MNHDYLSDNKTKRSSNRDDFDSIDISDEYALAEAIRNEISKLPSGSYRLGTDYSFVSCPYHSESTPSGRVMHNPNKPKQVGRFACFGCGKGKNLGDLVVWNGIAALLGLEQFGKKSSMAETPQQNFERMEEAFLSKKSMFTPLDPQRTRLLPLSAQNCAYAGLTKSFDGDYEWRGFSISFLRSLGFSFVFDIPYERYYIYMPVLVKGVLQGYVRAELQKPTDKMPSYWNASGKWSHLYGLFMFDTAIKMMREQQLSTIVLVEGPRDALRMLRDQVPAMAILGTQSWTNFKLTLLEFAGVERIITCMDGDEAGRLATRKIVQALDSNGNPILNLKPAASVFDVKQYKLWQRSPDDDPFKMHPEHVERIRSKLT